MSKKQYISPKYASSEIKHSNPCFNKLDIKEVVRKVPIFDMNKAPPRSDYLNKLWVKKDPGSKNHTDYDIAKSFELNSKKVSSPRFNKMMERSHINSIYFRTDNIKNDLDNEKLHTGLKATSYNKNGAYINWDKQMERDDLLYNQTEAMKNIRNENARYQLLQDILKDL